LRCRQIDVRDGEHFVRADEARLAQVLTSLLTNAVRFSPRGAHIVVTIERIGTSGAICVRDEGLGMSPEALAESFDPSVQHGQAFDRPSRGLGLGLTIARLVADVTGGTLTASSEGRGAGSVFVLTLPLVAADDTDENARADRP
jgi:two-component system CheB/CheR fusion protein